MINKIIPFKSSALATLLIVVASVLSPASTWGQDVDPIAEAKTYPPKFLSKQQNEINASVLSWQLVRLKKIISQNRATLDQINRKNEAGNEEVKAITKKLPIEHRGLDSSVRSQLAGKVLEEINNARLDAKTIDSSIAALEVALEKEKKSDATQDAKKSHLIDIRAAKRKCDVSRVEYEKASRLVQSGSKSKAQADMAKYTFEISEMELAKAELSLKNATSSKVSKLADQIVQKRIESVSVKARIKAAEEILRSFSNSQELFEAVLEVKNERAGWQLDKKAVVRELMQLEQEKTELETLKKMIDEELEKIKAMEDQEKK